MFAQLKLEDLLFIDIETVPGQPSYADLDERFQELWAIKSRQLAKIEPDPADIYERAGLHAEFGKIVCISIGILRETTDGQFTMRLKSFCNANEKELLEDLCDLLNTKFTGKSHCLCGHNIREFDIPYLCRRMLVNDICLPKLVDCTGLKPWEISHLDTLHLWRFGDSRSFVSLDLLAALFNIPSPKSDMSGSEVGRVFYEEKDLNRISRYCEQDVVTVAQLLLRFKSLPMLRPEDIQFT
ncbi:ribonuclease H-like domain-containing protein [Adhaeribacter radiodurans]|uniref:Ribonuclease H-like domain-containing protein n=1 Tax=Adhaeribacter radiodurans TaxID=2745197 RepID=A0A7L7L5E8_9BACT|nr:ribonuclease H-like domain-containing protein [Adhaeribacter radiodurans]QMU27835.1 ribonuclease H-like domain-containing protein [Adhaeribacter radiodurans]